MTKSLLIQCKSGLSNCFAHMLFTLPVNSDRIRLDSASSCYVRMKKGLIVNGLTDLFI